MEEKMRVIRTEEYFHSSEVIWDYEELIHGNPGVAIALIKLSKPGPSDFFNTFDRFDLRLNLGKLEPERSSRIIDHFLSASIQNLDSLLTDKIFSDVPISQPLVQRIRNLEVIIENSPPSLINFNELLKSAGPAVAIGTFIGISATTYPILLATVPAGIIVVGAAVGISKVIQDGLTKVLERWISKQAEPSERDDMPPDH
jgi:hypothetical protein